MNLQSVFCPNIACHYKHQVGNGNIVSHGKARERCKCKCFGHSFSYRQGTMFAGLRTDVQIVTWVVGLMAGGGPVAAIVAVFELDERTVADWMHQAGIYVEAFHHQQICSLDLQQVQVDEIRLKMQRQALWIAMAMSIGSRLWLGAVCRESRDKS